MPNCNAVVMLYPTFLGKGEYLHLVEGYPNAKINHMRQRQEGSINIQSQASRCCLRTERSFDSVDELDRKRKQSLGKMLEKRQLSSGEFSDCVQAGVGDVFHDVVHAVHGIAAGL